MKLLIALSLVFVSLLSIPVQASMFEESVETIAGTIKKIMPVEEEFIIGDPGMSGSLGIDRTISAHYVITLYDNKSNLNRGIILFQDQNDSGKTQQLALLEEGMKIEISGYHLRGDEGNYFEAYFDEIKVISD